MTKGTKIYRITVGVILTLTMLWSIFIGIGLFTLGTRFIHHQEYGIWVSGVSVTRSNKDDILGNGSVYYDSAYNTLVFDNAVIEAECSIIESANDLRIKLIGENKFICKNQSYIPAIYASENYINKDLAFEGNGSLSIEFQNISDNIQGIIADNITVASDVSLTTSNCANIVNGIVCTSSLTIVNGATVNVNNGAGRHSTAVRVRGNLLFEEGTALNITSAAGSLETCKGLSVNGDLVLGKNASLNVSVDDSDTQTYECVRVTGLFEAGSGATVTASSKKASAIECYSSVKLGGGATVTAKSEGDSPDILAYGAIANYGAEVSGETESLVGIFDKSKD